MQQYQSVTTVTAGRIRAIMAPQTLHDGYTLELDGQQSQKITRGVFEDHAPLIGWYLLRFSDGTVEFLPPERFAMLYKPCVDTRIKGYRNLSAEEVALTNHIKSLAEQVGAQVKCLEASSSSDGSVGPDPRWVGIAKDHLQQGFMALVRAVTKPETF